VASHLYPNARLNFNLLIIFNAAKFLCKITGTWLVDAVSDSFRGVPMSSFRPLFLCCFLSISCAAPPHVTPAAPNAATTEAATGLENPNRASTTSQESQEVRSLPVMMPAPVTTPPKLMVTESGEKRPMIVERINTHVVIRGHLAETTTTMLFRNPHDRVLEGELNFPLPEGATLSGFGLDVDGQVVDGVIVGKDEARVAFETEVRKGVDPGIAEWVRGNNFKTRVYPIPAGGTREVRVRYVHALIGSAEAAVYVLPLRYEHPIAQFDLRVEVVQGTVKPTTEGPFSNFSFASWEDRWVAEQSIADVEFDQDLRIAIPKRSPQSISVERDGSDHVFVVHDSLLSVPELETEWTPKRALLYWDASLSREGQIKQDLALLNTLEERWPDLLVDLVVIRDRLEAPQGFDTAASLIGALKDLDYDGGTDLASLDFPAQTQGEDYDFHLLFSDGMGNVGERPQNNTSVPLFTVGSSSSANHLMLRDLSEGSGGAHLNLSSMTIPDALALVGPEPYSFLGLDVVSGDVSDIYPRRKAPVSQRFNVTGRLGSDQAEVKLLYGRGDKVHRSVLVSLSTSNATDTGLVPRFWAQQEVNRLSAMARPDKAQLLELGRRYELVTPGASFLVLETLEQHLEHGVRPPDSRPELLKAWTAHKEAEAQSESSTREEKIVSLLAMWKTRVDWWESKSFPKKNAENPDDREGPRARREEGRVGQREPTGPGEPTPDSAVSEDALEFLEEFEEGDLQFESLGLGDAIEGELSFRGTGSGGGGAGSAAGSVATTGASGLLDNNQAGGSPGGNNDPSILVSAWDPSTPYMAALKAAGEQSKAYEAYLLQRPGYRNNPAYFLDCASYFFSSERSEIGRRILTSVLDLELDDPSLIRVVAYRLAETDDLDLAVELLRMVRRLRPEEPQSHRDLALMLARRAESADLETSGPEVAGDFNEAMALLFQVVMQDWDRFPEIEVIALMELNRLFVVSQKMPEHFQVDLNRPALDSRLEKLLDVDVRISLSWDADLTDIDLWVTEPTGEKAFYSNPRTAIGGLVSRDFTQGYGPEEYVLKKAVSGEYLIQANYYGSSTQTLTGPATVKAVVHTNWGRPNEERQEITLRLDAVKSAVTVANIAF
jgi:Ca-activated chloride channel family protein